MSFALNACQTTITILLSRNAESRIGISTSSSPVARGGRSARPSASVFGAAAQDPVVCTPWQETDGLDLISLMIGPVQHFPRYRGLLEEMQRSARAPLRAVCEGLCIWHARPSVGWRATTSAPKPPCVMHWAPSAPGWTRPTKGSASSRPNAAYPPALIVRVASRPFACGPLAVVRGRDVRAAIKSAYAARGNTNRAGRRALQPWRSACGIGGTLVIGR
jgi:hypothetical protein